MSSPSDGGQNGTETPTKRVRVLVYVAEAADSIFATTLLGRSSVEIVHAANLSNLCLTALKLLPELIILDWRCFGEVAARQLLGNPATATLPLALIARYEDAERVPDKVLFLPSGEFYRWDHLLGGILAWPHRAAPRVAVSLSAKVRVETATESHPAKVLDLSVSGAQIETAAALPFAVSLILQVDLPDDRGQLACRTVVQQYRRELDCYRYGLRFTAMDNSNAILLADFLKSQLASQGNSSPARP